jgi:hypothetical protein
MNSYNVYKLPRFTVLDSQWDSILYLLVLIYKRNVF